MNFRKIYSLSDEAVRLEFQIDYLEAQNIDCTTLRWRLLEVTNELKKAV